METFERKLTEEQLKWLPPKALEIVVSCWWWRSSWVKHAFRSPVEALSVDVRIHTRRRWWSLKTEISGTYEMKADCRKMAKILHDNLLDLLDESREKIITIQVHDLPPEGFNCRCQIARLAEGRP